MNPEPALTQAIWRAIEAHPNSKIPLIVLQRAAAAVDTTGAATVGWRARILTAIRHLEDDGRITLAKTRLDTSSNPPLPLFVNRPAGPKARRPRTPPPVWHADLAWAAALFDQGELTSADQRFLTAINSWLSKRRGVPVPLRERSLEIFGHEKLLETRVTGPLFAPGRLTLALLQTYLCWPPVERMDCGPGDWLIVENYTTYHSLAQRARQLGFDGQIIWGSGNGVTTRLSALASEPTRPPRLYYFGDIDAGGFRVARSAAGRAAYLNMPRMTAAHGLYTLTYAHGISRPDTNTRKPDQTVLAWTREWLADPLTGVIAELLAKRERIVQEAVGKELLATTSLGDWF